MTDLYPPNFHPLEHLFDRPLATAPHLEVMLTCLTWAECLSGSFKGGGIWSVSETTPPLGRSLP